MNSLIRICVVFTLVLTAASGWSKGLADEPAVTYTTPSHPLPTIQWSNLPPELSRWQGTWNCYHYGKMYLVVTDPHSRKIAGNYTFSNGTVSGLISPSGDNLYGRWQQPNGGGAFHFRLGPGKFGPGWAGKWNYDSAAHGSKQEWTADPWDCTKISDDIIQ